MRFDCTPFLHFSQSGIDFCELVRSRIRIGELYLAHVRQYRQLVEVVTDGLLLPQDFFQSVKNDDFLAQTTTDYIALWLMRA